MQLVILIRCLSYSTRILTDTLLHVTEKSAVTRMHFQYSYAIELRNQFLSVAILNNYRMKLITRLLKIVSALLQLFSYLRLTVRANKFVK